MASWPTRRRRLAPINNAVVYFTSSIYLLYIMFFLNISLTWYVDEPLVVRDRSYM